jgi:hypothetical protein
MLVILVGSVWASQARAGIIYVAASAAAGGSGVSWASPLNDLQAALALAQAGDEVRLAQGLYRPGPPGSPRSATFLVGAAVQLRGGYAGPGAPDPDFRDPELTPSILSGDLAGNDGPNFSNRADNAYHVVTIPATAGSPTLDGLTVRAGYANGGFLDRSGGGVFATGSSPTLTGCTFTDNDSGFTAGAAHLAGGAPTIQGCRFIANRGQSGAGGVYTLGGSTANIRDCLFEANIGGYGPAAFNDEAASAPRFERCTFTDNVGIIGGNTGCFLDRSGSATLIDCDFFRNSTDGGGGAVFCWDSSTTLIGCRFIGNVALFDGGGAFYASGFGHQRLINCFFTGNTTHASGGAALINSAALTEFIHCTLVNNGDPAGPGTCGGVAAYGDGSAEFRGCVLWANIDPQVGVQEAQVVMFGGAVGVFERCIVQGWNGTLGGSFSSGDDPLLVDADGPDNIRGNADDDARPGGASPAIDASDNAWMPPGVVTDLDGAPRFRDDAGVPDRGVPGGAGGAAIADLGCYEFQGTTCYANCDLSSIAPALNVLDFNCFLNRFAAGAPYANCDGSTVAPALNILDFNCFLNAFAAGCP